MFFHCKNGAHVTKESLIAIAVSMGLTVDETDGLDRVQSSSQKAKGVSRELKGKDGPSEFQYNMYSPKSNMQGDLR